MSRFPELFEEAIEEVVIGEAFLIEVLAEHIAAHIVERQRALRAQVRISARYPIERTTPVTGLPTQEMVELIGIAAASATRRAAARRRRGRGHQRVSVRAGARARPGERATARGGLRRRGRRADPRARPDRDAQPARTRDALRRHADERERRAARRDRRGLDERARLRAPEAARRAVRRRARASPAAVRRGLGAARAEGRPRRATPIWTTGTSSSHAR